MASVRKDMLHGVLWTAIGKYSGLFISIAISVVLARLISPEEFGIVAIAQVAISFISIISDLGVGAGIVQNKTLSEKDYDSLFTFTILLALLLAMIIILASPLLASFYSNGKIVKICLMLALSTFFGVMTTVPESLFTKNKRFSFTAKRSLCFSILSGLACIIYAFMGGGAYALALSPIITSLGMLIIGLKEYPRKIDWQFNLTPLKKIFGFSIFQFLFNMVNYFSRNLDKLIIGKALNLNELGYYQKSYSLMMMPVSHITFVITPVLQPYLSDFQHNLQFIRDKYEEIIKLLATISFPIGIFLYMSSTEIIVIMFGQQWLPAVLPFEILAWSLPLQIVLSTAGSIFQSTNNTKYLFVSGLINTSITVIGFVLCVLFQGGLSSFSLAWDLTLLINFVITYILFNKKVFKHCPLQVYKQMLHPLYNIMFILIVFLLIKPFLTDLNLWSSLLLKFLLCSATTILCIYFFNDYDIQKVLYIIKEKIWKKY